MTDAGISELLSATAQAVREAQSDLNGPTAVAIGEVDLEVKATVRAGAGGGLTLEPIGAADLRAGSIPPDVVSTVRARFLAVADTPVGSMPTQDREAVVGRVAARPDVARLLRVLSGARFDAVFEPQTRRWLVTLRDDHDRIAREVVVADEPEPGRA